MAGRGVAQPAGGAVIDAVPDGAEQLAVALHLVGLVERGEHLRGAAEVGARQGLRAQRVGDRHRQQRRAHAVAADVDQVEREVLVVDPVVAEGIAAQLGRRNEAPVDRQGLGQRRRQHGAHVALGVAQLLLQPVVGELQGFARRGELAMGARQLLVGRFELRDEPGLALAQQGHVVGLLLHPARLLVLGRHVEQEDPDRAVVGEEVDVRHAPAGHFHGADEEGRLRQRQQAFEERDLVARGAAGLRGRPARSAPGGRRPAPGSARRR